MARIQPAGTTDEAQDLAAGRRKAVRYVVPVAVAGVAAATIGLVPAIASTGDPDLPKITAEELLTKVAKSDVQQLSGTVKVTTDLGLPALPTGGGAGGPFGGGAAPKLGTPGGGESGEGESSPAAPQAKLMELAAGTHTLRVAADGPDKQRISIIDKAAEYSLIHNGDQLWAYDSGTNSVYHSTTAGAGRGEDAESHGLENASPQELAKRALDAVDETTSVSVDGTAKVAGRDAYQLLIRPKQSESTIGSIRIAVDAGSGVPLKFTLQPKGGGKAAVDAGFSSVDFGKPDAKMFDFAPPKGAKVTEDKAGAHRDAESKRAAKEGRELAELSGLNVLGTGWTSVAQVKEADKALDGAKGEGAKGGGAHGSPGKRGDADTFLDGMSERVTGSFGSGRVFSTRLVNALMTDDGAVYVGAVDKAALIKAAEGKKK
ncbi:LolA family protein [Streptomyces sp. URMC 123]|uniref:LolA family protein n=1 Tax=Streptomyces sp. URMC 123 TaxID=3423403 RepID=UPI003F1BCBE8